MTEIRRLNASLPVRCRSRPSASKRGGHAIENSAGSADVRGIVLSAASSGCFEHWRSTMTTGDGDGWQPPTIRHRPFRARRPRTFSKASSTNSRRPRAIRTAMRSSSRSPASRPGPIRQGDGSALGHARRRRCRQLHEHRASRSPTARRRAALAAFDISVNQIAAGAATLSWKPPTENADGSDADRSCRLPDLLRPEPQQPDASGRARTIRA